MRSRLVLALVATAATGVVAAPSSAATLSTTGDVITYQAGPGEANRVTINWGGGRPSFSDTPDVENAMTIGPGCQDTYGDRAIIECPGASPNATIIVRLGDGDDRADVVGGVEDQARGKHHELYGEGGNDVLLSEEGSDLLDGGEGNDELQPDDMDSGGQAGAGDTVAGGPGQDKLQLVDSPQDVLRASLDGVADDGGPGEGDNYLADVEDIQGSRGASNTLIGTPGPNTIQMISDDRTPNTLVGAGGDDRLLGGGGNDSLDGGDGNDTLVGGAFNDTLVGGPGLDALDGDGDTLYPGNDRIEARDGVAESINCGIGADTAIIDATDTVPADGGSICEVVDRAAASAPPTPSPAPAATAPRIRSTALRYRRARIAVAIACPAGRVRCTGTLGIRTARKVRVGTKRRTVTIARALLRRSGEDRHGPRPAHRRRPLPPAPHAHRPRARDGGPEGQGDRAVEGRDAPARRGRPGSPACCGARLTMPVPA
jgi:hypothetical protein